MDIEFKREMIMKIPLAKPSFPQGTMEAVKRVLDSGWVTQGPVVEEFEREYAVFNSSKFAVAVSSGTAALHVSMVALGIGLGDEVIVPDFSFPATGNAVLYVGAKPVLVDIDLSTYCIDLSDIKKKITEKTKAIMVVHAFGHPSDMDPILEIAEKYNLYVVEDAAPAHGSKYKGKKVGNFGDIGCYSFHPRKILTTGEGGMIVTHNEELANLIRSIRNQGSSSLEKNHLPFPRLGFNYRMSDIHAAIGLEQLKTLDKVIEGRRKIASLYESLLTDHKDIVLPEEKSYAYHVFQSYILLLKKSGIRNEILTRMKELGIECTIGTYSMSNLTLFEGICPQGTKAYEDSFVIPMFEGLKDEEIEYVTKSLVNILKTLKN